LKDQIQDFIFQLPEFWAFGKPSPASQRALQIEILFNHRGANFINSI
jgi:hypothetical protein